jgi:glyoxylase-like metal-dependent hydrolase (beta-lactamase superfamily II)
MADQQNKLSLVQAQLGPMANFVYIIADPATRKAAVVDPAWDVKRIVDYAESKGYEIEKILVTHYHQDHIGGNMMGQSIQGAAEMVGRVKAKVYVNKNEAEGVKKVTFSRSVIWT